MKTAAVLNVLLDRIEENLTTGNNFRDGRIKALADLEAMRADRDACAKAAAHAQAEASTLRAKLEASEAASIKHHTRALTAEEKVQGYHKSLTEHRVLLESKRLKNSPPLPPLPASYDDDSIPF